MINVCVPFDGQCRVATVGKQPVAGRQLQSWNDITLWANEMGADNDRICHIVAPSNSRSAGYQTIGMADYANPVYAEGVVLTEEGSAAVIQTADCPVIVMRNRKNGNVLVTHAGRPALTPPDDCDACQGNIVAYACRRILGWPQEPDAVEVFVTAHICGQCFVHDQPGAEAYVAPFDRFGAAAFTDRSRGALDMFAIIKAQMIGYRIDEERISRDGRCTKETGVLASYRQGDRTRNTIIVVRD